MLHQKSNFLLKGSIRDANFSAVIETMKKLIGLFHFLSVQGDGRNIPGLVKSMNFQRSTAKYPKIPGGLQHFATKSGIEIEIFILTDFSRQSCCCKQEFQGKKGKNIFQGARLENCTSTKSLRHSRTLVVHPLTFSGGFSEGKHARDVFPGTIIQTTENSTQCFRKTLHPLAFADDKARKDAR